MRRAIRDALAEVRRQGGIVVDVREGGHHTEVLFEINGARSILRLHLGSKVTGRAERALRSAVRSAGRQGQPI